MKALVTGASGQVGRALIATAPDGWSVVAPGRDDLDLADLASIRRVIEAEQPDWLLNAAAYTAVDRAESEEPLATAINGTAVAEMVSALRDNGGRLAQISTDFVFNGRSARAYRPDDLLAPLSAYGRSKAAGEAALGPKDILLRTAWVYAAGGANFVRTMLRLMEERDELRVVRDQIGAPTWATGLARTLWGLVTDGTGGVYHHSDAGIASWFDFAVAIQEEALALGLLKRQVPIHPVATSEFPTPAERPAFSLLDCSATRNHLGDDWIHWRTNLRVMLEEEMALG